MEQARRSVAGLFPPSLPVETGGPVMVEMAVELPTLGQRRPESGHAAFLWMSALRERTAGE
jgi:hypothetical protein